MRSLPAVTSADSLPTPIPTAAMRAVTFYLFNAPTAPPGMTAAAARPARRSSTFQRLSRRKGGKASIKARISSISQKPAYDRPWLRLRRGKDPSNHDNTFVKFLYDRRFLSYACKYIILSVNINGFQSRNTPALFFRSDQSK